MISKRQLKILQNLLGKRFNDREERIAFLSDFAQRELSSSKELTEGEFFELLDWLKYNYAKEAQFDSYNTQHLSLLAKCHELGWVREDNPKIPDLGRLGKFLLSKRCPIQKPLKEMTTNEVSKVIGALSGIIEKRHEKTSPSPLQRGNECKHERQILRTIDGYCTVQITAVFCQDCGKQLTEAKVEV